jgi:hypothetical protein
MGGRVAGFHSVGVSKEMARPINLNCLEVFGLNAVSMGYSNYSLGELSGTEIVEEKTRQADYRMILRDGNVLGMQVIASNNLPSLLGLIHNSKTFSAIENRLGCTLFMAKNPFHFPWPTRKHSENSKRIGSD